jgi:heme-degrading monooxygenase HmoA
MPTFPWTATTELDPQREYFVIATRFDVTRRRFLPEVVRATQALWPALSAADGLIGYTLQASLVRPTLSTLSVWQDRAAMHGFVRAAPHAAVVRASRPRMAGSSFTGWTALGAELPPTWASVDQRLRDQQVRDQQVRDQQVRDQQPGFGPPG